MNMKAVELGNRSPIEKTRQKSAWRRLQKYKFYYLLILPGLLYFIIWHYIPMFGIVIAFKDIAPFEGIKGIVEGDWVGFKHFVKFFSSHYFWNILGNTLAISLYKLVFGFPAPILLALVLNELKGMAYKRVAQTVVYLPHFISWVIVSGMAFSIFSSSDGVINILLKNMGIEAIPFLTSPRWFRQTLIGIEIWKEAGWGTIIYLATLAGVDIEQYEAAYVDGATRLQRLLYITLPSISSTIAVLLILRTGNLMRAGFEQIYLLYNPMVYEVADVLETFAYRNGVMEGRISYATALGLLQSALSVVLVLSANKISRKISGQSLY